MTFRFPLAALAVSLLLAPAAAAAPEDLDTVKELYASASYEAALSRLDALSGVDIVVANQYRALCLLGLGRGNDAESALREIVTANPLYLVSPNDVSPRLVAMFTDVRKRALPTAARQLYGKAKHDYDEKNHASAVAQFKTLLELLNDKDLQASRETGDLKDLAEGFLTLANAQIAKSAPPAAAPVTAAAPVPAAPKAPAIFSAENRDVRGPVEVQRTMPAWSPTSAMDQRRVFRGVIRLTIDEEGRVEEAELITPVFPGYNDELLRAAKSWRYRPATRGGAPVKYSLTLAIILRPQGSAE